MLLVLILSVVFIPSKLYALTLKEKEERLHNLCEKYEERFDNHAGNYSKSLQWKAKHISFSHHKVLQDALSFSHHDVLQDALSPHPLDILRKKIATASFDGISKLTLELGIYFLHFGADNTFDGRTSFGYDQFKFNLYKGTGEYKGIGELFAYVSDTSPEAGTTRSLVGSLWDLGSSLYNIDQGAFVVLMLDGSYRPVDYGYDEYGYYGHGFFKTDCTECANLMAKFLNEAMQIMQN